MKLLTVGFLICIAAAVAILFALRSDEKVVAQTRTPESVTAVTSDTTATREVPTDRPAARAVPRERARPTRPTPSNERPSTAPSQDAVVDDEPIPIDDRGLPMVSVTKPDVADANLVIEPLVRECISQSGFTGSGTAVLRLTISRQREKEKTPFVEDTGFDEEGTTLGSEEKLVECLHKTALQMTFPKSQTGGALWATRMVVIENGQLKEHSVIDIGRMWSQYRN